MHIVLTLYSRFLGITERVRDLPPLIFRFILAYGFFEPAINKLTHFKDIVVWFRDTLQIPFPELNAIMAVGTENLGYVLLTLGLGTRLISIPLMVVMVVAIKTVHLKHGFACGHNGFEIPFYYFFMLFSLVVGGAGRLSIDALLSRKFSRT